MKKILLLCVAFLLAGCSATTAQDCPVCEPCTVDQTTTTESTQGASVDAYTSASATKAMLSGEEATAAIEILQGIDSDLATKAETEAEGYTAPENEAFVEIIGINPDGTPGLSTIHAWRVDGDTVTVVMTDGQNAQNISTVGAKATILAHAESYYQLHLETVEVNKLEYTDENYNNGLFNSAYSGAEYGACEYTVTFKLLAVEQVNLYVPN